MNNNTKARFKSLNSYGRRLSVFNANERNAWNKFGKVARNDKAVAKGVKALQVSQVY